MNIQAIISELEKLPSEIRTCQMAYVEAKDKTERAKLKLEVAMSRAMLKSAAQNAIRQKADAVLVTEIEKGELFDAQLEESKRQCELDYRLNNFIACRKIAALEEKLYQPNSTGF